MKNLQPPASIFRSRVPAICIGAALLIATMLAVGCSPSETRRSSIAHVETPSTAAAVRAEMLHSWRGYEHSASGHDDLRPLSKVGRERYGRTLLVTRVGALDILLLMGLDEEAATTHEYIVANLRFDLPITVKVFEITIRELGGLLSAYEMTGDERLLALAGDSVGVALCTVANGWAGSFPKDSMSVSHSSARCRP